VGNARPKIEFIKPVVGQTFHFGDTVQVEVKVTDDQPVDCTKVSLNYIVGHQTHGHPISSSTGCTGQFETTYPSGHDPSEIRAVFAASYTDPGTGADGEGALTGNAEIALTQTP
jgi:cytochrome c